MANCEICGEPMPLGEEMFKYHGYSGPCPKPPLAPVKMTNNQDGWMSRALKLEAALKLIAELGGKTILGPEYDDERLHEQGAAKAFEQCADIARNAIAG